MELQYDRCPVCEGKLDITETITKYVCPRCPYEVTYFHYGSQYQIDGEWFELDESAYGNEKALEGMAVAVARLRRGLTLQGGDPA